MNLYRRSRGFSLIEAMVAIIILSVGLLALAVLQARLMRSSSDGKLQSAALALAKGELENQRRYRNADAWRDIVDTPAATVNLAIGGQNFAFTRGMTVNRFRWNPTPVAPAIPAFAMVEPDNIALNNQPEFKRVAVDVSWTNESGETRQVTLTDVISSIMPADSASLIARPNANRSNPVVRIFAPSAEGIIPIAIGDGMSSASSNPKPVQFDASGGATLTRFNVQNYLSDGGNPLLQRRLEFAYASCKCRLDATTSTTTDPAYEATVWTGERYAVPRPIVGRVVSQAINQINDQQDVNRLDDLCTSCCRDHQDDSGSVTERPAGDIDPSLQPRYKVDPFRAIAEYASGKHKHYVNASPTEFLAPPLTVAAPRDEYFEACRLVRVDGINRVSVDSRLENLVSLNLSPTQRADPNNALATLPSALVTQYATFAKRYVEQALGIDTSTTPPDSSVSLPTGYPVGGLADQVGSPGSPGDPSANPPIPPTPATFTALAREYDVPFLDLDEDDRVELPLNRYHNLSARGIYVDFLTSETRNAIACIGNTARNCAAFRNRNPLELVPFFAVNLTNLNYFRKADGTAVLQLEPNGFPQTYGQDFVRGRVRATGAGDSRIFASSRRGNAGLTDQIPVYPDSNQLIHEGEPFRVGGNQSNRRALIKFTCPTCANNSVFFTKMGQKQLNTTPDGSACAYGANDNSVRECTLGTDSSITSASARFASYVFATCPNNYTYNPATNLCARTLNNGTTQTQTPVIADYTLCRLTNLPAGVTATVGAPTSPGVPAETTTATLGGIGLAALLETTLPNSPIQALFVPSTGTCP